MNAGRSVRWSGVGRRRTRMNADCDVVIQQEPDRPEQVGFPGSVLADDGVDALVENQLRVGEIAIVD